ncbi:MAE_28990/MAE_18760 family HEPN-like nuclease [Labrys neptuniae]|uniref:MAE_28990/MAE_18760 family HEPN-like nuclease n=1 Tax=Labrys neptuniae TaxID=376174 RepID=UPI0028923D60|nr:MAE_28990/MAE_18760 family HEPN-like nuclease [Labrys neptuniae]MDT3382543.1 MAE_28990/MAE_18760 family HEPN-like nuclease [Labrys neptuniae]
MITSDLGWRESELGSFKILLRKFDITPVQKEALLRASWALLYAHYEGFVKFCLTIYYDTICSTIDAREKLSERLQHTSLRSEFKSARSLPDTELVKFILEFENKQMKDRPAFGEVETQSNLWPSVLDTLLREADLETQGISQYHSKLKVLVARRNSIAHGDKNFIKEVDYYLGFENDVYSVMYILALEIDRKINEINV